MTYVSPSHHVKLVSAGVQQLAYEIPQGTKMCVSISNKGFRHDPLGSWKKARKSLQIDVDLVRRLKADLPLSY